MKEKGRKGVLGRASVFEESLKIAVAREYLHGQLSYSQIAKKYELPSGDTARFFVRWYKEWQLKQEGKEVITPSSCSQEEILRQELGQAHLRITALELLIQNAEKELGIDIRKKSGTKQRRK
jgi:transposase-like protein